MFLESEESNQAELENSQIEETERKVLTCPDCGKEFQDMRGLTSHARHMHNITKEELEEIIQDEGSLVLKVLGGLGAFLAAMITLGNNR
jgi:peptide subunit release factor 1 (eRF1)